MRVYIHVSNFQQCLLVQCPRGPCNEDEAQPLHSARKSLVQQSINHEIKGNTHLLLFSEFLQVFGLTI